MTDQMKYEHFALPTEIKVEDDQDKPNECRFVCEPLERGFGHTLGNTLRRVLLTSIESPAILSVDIEGITHEYMAVDGIKEDMTHIILNLKSALLRKLPLTSEKDSKGVKRIEKMLTVTQADLDESDGQYVVTLGNILSESEFEVVNPELYLFSVTRPMDKLVVIKIIIGRGYVPAEKQIVEKKSENEIVIDTPFSPVRQVNYFVENCRVGDRTDMDRLIVELKTDGRITPKEALSFSSKISIHHFNIFEKLHYQAVTFEENKEEEITEKDILLNKLKLRISEIELSVRSTNCLAQANIDTIAELVIMPEYDMLRFRNFGKKSLNEIKSKLEEMHLHLGMDLSAYGLTKENVKTLIVEMINEDKEV